MADSTPHRWSKKIDSFKTFRQHIFSQFVAAYLTRDSNLFDRKLIRKNRVVSLITKLRIHANHWQLDFRRSLYALCAQHDLFDIREKRYNNLKQNTDSAPVMMSYKHIKNYSTQNVYFLHACRIFLK